MSRRTDQETLLADVLAEEARPGFADALLVETLRQARRRRHGRATRRAAGVLVVLLLTGLAVWQNVPRRKHVKEFAKPAVPPAPYQLIVSQPLPATQLITSQPLVVPIEVAEQTLTIIRTYGGGFREVGDEELLALAAPQTAALIRRGPHEAELVFVSDPRQETEESN